MFREQGPRATDLPVFELPPPEDINLSASNIGVERPSSKRTAHEWERQRPSTFSLAGEEDASNRNGYTSASPLVRGKTDAAALQTTKRGLLYQLEQLAGTSDELIDQLSEKIRDAPVISTANELGKLVASGWRPGSSWIRLAVQE